MSNTIVDMPKVAQMLDAGWDVCIYKGDMGSYVAVAKCADLHFWWKQKGEALAYVTEHCPEFLGAAETDWYEDCTIYTDDFTPEQALTRLAYKVQGEYLV